MRARARHAVLLAHLKMALFNRANLNVLSLINHCYCKFSTGTMTLKQNKRFSFTSELVRDRFHKQDAENSLEMSNSRRMIFDTEIANRRNQACRSILVQVYSSNSYEDLQNYCSKFGNILSMHHYRVDKQHNYILIEFKTMAAVNEIISRTSFVDSNLMAPVKSSVLWFRKGQLVNGHNGQIGKLYLSTENGCMFPTEKQIANLLYNAKSVSGQIIDLYETLRLNELEIRLRFHAAAHLERYFSGLFQDRLVLPFGSSINGFGWKKCDLDLVLVSDSTKKENSNSRLVFHTKPMKVTERHEMKEFMSILATTMQHFIPGIRNVRKILEARVPIIKFNYEYIHLECDLSVTNMGAIYMSELLYLYGEIDWRVRPLTIMIRTWAKNQEITCESPGHWITNFSLSLLILFYLQQKNILPSLKSLKSLATLSDVRYTENGIDCTFLRDVTKLPPEFRYKSNQDSLELLLLGFFEYYSAFDFYTKGICIREGVPVRKPSNSPLHIVNPLETILNVSKNVSIYQLNRLTEKSNDAAFLLETSNQQDRMKNGSWGIISILKMSANLRPTVKTKSNKAKGENIEDYVEGDESEEAHRITANKLNGEIDLTEKKEEVV